MDSRYVNHTGTAQPDWYQGAGQIDAGTAAVAGVGILGLAVSLAIPAAVIYLLWKSAKK